jgi:hypothetical protein
MIPVAAHYLRVNESHQLLVSVSKHLYVLRSGAVTFQKKAMDVNLKNYRRTGREHVIHYIVRDEASGMMYAELHSGQAPCPVMDFLCRAWREKHNFYFEGMPKELCVPETVYTDDLGHALHALGIRATRPESGFRAGIRSVRSWEEALTWFALHYPGIRNFAELRHYTEHLAHDLNRYDEFRVALWEGDDAPKRLPSPDQIRPYCRQRVPVERRSPAHFPKGGLTDD